MVRDDFKSFGGLIKARLQMYLDEFSFRRNMKVTEEGLWIKLLLVVGTKQHTAPRPTFR